MTQTNTIVQIRAAILIILCLASSMAYVKALSWKISQKFKCCYAIEVYPLWNASKALVNGVNPYSSDVTAQNEDAIYGGQAQQLGFEGQQFAYPIYAAFPLLPLASFSFPFASVILSFFFAAFLAFQIGWLRRRWDFKTTLYTGLIVASYPVPYDFDSLQPTLLFLGFAIAGLSLFDSKHYVAAAALVALATGKPQIALPFLLPMLITALANWEQRKPFVLLLMVFLALLTAIGLNFVPRWCHDWLLALKVYSAYAEPSMTVYLFGNYFGKVVTGILLIGLLIGLWLHRKSDLLFQTALSISVMSAVVPYRTYNAIVLCIPLVWLADNQAIIRSIGAANELALAAVRIAVVGLWLLTAVGAGLLYFSHAYWQIGFLLPITCLKVVLVTVLLCIMLQCFTSFQYRSLIEL